MMGGSSIENIEVSEWCGFRARARARARSREEGTARGLGLPRHLRDDPYFLAMETHKERTYSQRYTMELMFIPAPTEARMTMSPFAMA